MVGDVHVVPASDAAHLDEPRDPGGMRLVTAGVDDRPAAVHGTLTDAFLARRTALVRRILSRDVSFSTGRSLARPDPLADVMRPGAPPETVVEAAYRIALGRRPDPGGLAAWSAFLTSGHSPLEVVARLLESIEGRARGEDDRTVLANLISKAAEAAAAVELTAAQVEAGHLYRPGLVRAEIFVRAVIEVTLGRAATPDEVDGELDRIAAGTGRESLIHRYARRPECLRRFAGPSPRGPRSFVIYVRNRMGLVATVRRQVEAVERRTTDSILALTAVASAGASEAHAARPEREE